MMEVLALSHLLPEERVRRRLLRVLVEELGYPKSRIVIEKELALLPHLQGCIVPKRRLDLLVYDQEFCPLIVFECKAKDVTQAALEQVLGYNHVIGAPFVSVVGEENALCCDASGKSIGGLKGYQELLEMACR